MEKDDWRLQGQARYLSGKRLYRIPFRPCSAAEDHDHCAFCMDKFMLHPDCLSEGYCTAPENQPGAHWLCPACYEDFRAQFGWTVEGS